MLCKFVGLEEYDLATRVNEAWRTGMIASHAKILALIGKRQIDGEQLGSPRYTTVNGVSIRQGEENMSAWEFRASDVPSNIDLI